jgi:hypothetical protein
LTALEFENLFLLGKRFLPEGWNVERNISGSMDPAVVRQKQPLAVRGTGGIGD